MGVACVACLFSAVAGLIVHLLSIWCLMMDKNRSSSNKIKRMDEVVVRDRCWWLKQKGFLKAYNMKFIDRD